LEEGLREGLREHGYVEGKNIIIEWRRSEGAVEELKSAAADLARVPVELIVASGSPAVRAALDVTTLPVVFLSGNPVSAGFAESLARPGGNATGVSAVTTELNQNCVQFLHLLVPKSKRIFYLRNPANPIAALGLDEVEGTARALGMRVLTLDARNARELNVTLRKIRRSAADAVLVSPEMFFLAHRSEITGAVRKTKMPAMFTLREYHDEGALMSYGGSIKEAMRRVAGYVSKILKGTKPAEIPVEQLSKYELIIDLRIAHELGIEVPQTLLLRADEVRR
jgi:putative ABC transport system substrate-binding protein